MPVALCHAAMRMSSAVSHSAHGAATMPSAAVLSPHPPCQGWPSPPCRVAVGAAAAAAAHPAVRAAAKAQSKEWNLGWDLGMGMWYSGFG